MERSDRMAVVVMLREPVIDWINSVSPDDPVWLDELAGRTNVYLIPRYDTVEDAEEYVRGYFDQIFCNELGEWIDDESHWPQKRTYEMFEEWFDVLYDVSVFDTQPKKTIGHQN